MAVHTKKYAIEERRRRVASYLAQSLTEKEIAELVGVDRTTTSRDVTSLKKTSQTFIFDLAKSDLAFYYKQCLDGMAEANRQAWTTYYKLQKKAERFSSTSSERDSLMALKIIKELTEARFLLFKEGPGAMQIKAMHDKLEELNEIGSE
jgi:hypothetical protein